MRERRRKRKVLSSAALLREPHTKLNELELSAWATRISFASTPCHWRHQTRVALLHSPQTIKCFFCFSKVHSSCWSAKTLSG